MRRSTSFPIVAPQERIIEGLVVATQKPTIRTIKGIVSATQKPIVRVKEELLLIYKNQKQATDRDKPKTMLKRRTCHSIFF
jgi:hypothetical protein